MTKSQVTGNRTPRWNVFGSPAPHLPFRSFEGYFEQDTQVVPAGAKRAANENAERLSGLVGEFSGEPFDHVRVKPEQLGGGQPLPTARPMIVGPFLDTSPGGMSQDADRLR